MVSGIDPRSVAFTAQMNHFSGLSKLWPYNVFLLDEESHPVVRALFQKALSGFSLRRDLIQEEARRWAACLASKSGEEVDLIEACCELSGNVMLQLIGLPPVEPSFFVACRPIEYLADLGCTPVQYAAADRAINEVWQICENLLATPGVRDAMERGMLGYMMASTDFTDDDRIRMIIMMIMLSVANSAGLIYRLLSRLSEDAGQRAVFQMHPALLAAKAVNASLWRDPAVWYILRHLGEESAVVAGQEFASWSHVVMMPFLLQHLKEDPTFDMIRHGTTRVLSFGKVGTPHHCLGEGLARFLGSEALRAANDHGLLERIEVRKPPVPSISSFFMHPSRHRVSLG
jgi:cytochrome P450